MGNCYYFDAKIYQVVEKLLRSKMFVLLRLQIVLAGKKH
jgi:hypothetical protein